MPDGVELEIEVSPEEVVLAMGVGTRLELTMEALLGKVELVMGVCVTLELAIELSPE